MAANFVTVDNQNELRRKETLRRDLFTPWRMTA